MGDRGHNAGGWAYMPRVWCPLCGFSFLIGRAKYDRDATKRHTDRPEMRCANVKACHGRVRRKRG